HEIGGFDVRISLGDRELYPLIGADRPAKHHTIAGVTRCPLDEPSAIADRLGRDEDPLHIPSIDDVAESLTFFSNAILDGDLHVFEKDSGRVMVHHDVQRLNVQMTLDVTHVNDEYRKSLRLVFQFLVRSRSSQKKHQIGLLRARYANFLSVHDIP